MVEAVMAMVAAIVVAVMAIAIRMVTALMVAIGLPSPLGYNHTRVAGEERTMYLRGP
jgi:lipopolysaccharide/colanic/teichoic acid biosynthesis glycosyltransferase